MTVSAKHVDHVLAELVCEDGQAHVDGDVSRKEGSFIT